MLVLPEVVGVVTYKNTSNAVVASILLLNIIYLFCRSMSVQVTGYSSNVTLSITLQ